MANERNVRYLLPGRPSPLGDPGFIFSFDDMVNNELRLTIYGHLRLENTQSTGILRIDDGPSYTGAAFARLLRLSYGNYNAYSRARLVMCFSGYAPEGQVSFAQAFANETNLVTEAYRGIVRVESTSRVVNAVNRFAAAETRICDRAMTNAQITAAIWQANTGTDSHQFFSIVEDVYDTEWPSRYEPVEFHPQRVPTSGYLI